MVFHVCTSNNLGVNRHLYLASEFVKLSAQIGLFSACKDALVFL